MSGAAILVTGVQGAGKSTVGRLLASRLRRAAFIEGDLLWKMVVSGRADMTAETSDEARRQLELRYRHGALLAASFARAGFVAVHVDNVYGEDVSRYLEWLSCPKALVVLRPEPAVVARRERDRGASAYEAWLGAGRSLEDVVTEFDGWLSTTPRMGLWIDSSEQTPEQTVEEILRRWDDAFVSAG